MLNWISSTLETCLMAVLNIGMETTRHAKFATCLFLCFFPGIGVAESCKTMEGSDVDERSIIVDE